jgi:hypothetical protein
MFNTFTDAFSTDGNNTNKMNGTNPFDLPSSSTTTTDPFGISSSTKLAESSEKFDDNPFIVDANNTKSVRPRSGKEALSSSNWLAYQHSMDEANLDPLEDLQEKSLITQPNSVNPNNPFSISPNTNQSETSPFDQLFDANDTILPTNQNQSSYDFLDFNQINTSSSSSTVPLENNSSTALPKSNQNITSPSSLPTNTIPPTSNPSYNDQFLDWFTQSDDPKLNGSLKKIDINSVKSTEDPFGSVYRHPSALATLRMHHKSFFLVRLKFLF